MNKERLEKIQKNLNEIKNVMFKDNYIITMASLEKDGEWTGGIVSHGANRFEMAVCNLHVCFTSILKVVSTHLNSLDNHEKSFWKEEKEILELFMMVDSGLKKLDEIINEKKIIHGDL